MRPKWEIKETIVPDTSFNVALNKIKNVLLNNRGINSIEKFNSFIHVENKDSYDPFLLPDMKKAVDRISNAINNQEIIGILGDFDVDGLTGTALLCKALKQLKVETIPYIPNRVTEGHGLNKGIIDKFKSRNVSLIITVDCGTGSAKEVEYASSLDIETIITDHHTITSELPKAIAIVNPLQSKSQYQFTKLTGAGLAYKLTEALFSFLGLKYPTNLIQMAAIGTIGDIAPLIEENRYIVKNGIDEIKKTPNPGIQTIIELIRYPTEINSELISFQIIPKLNAPGRLDSPELSLEILLTDDYAQAKIISRKLDFINDKRKFLTDQVMEEALDKIDNTSEIIFLEDDQWPIGIIGLVANKIQDQFNKPAFIIHKSIATSRGSARCPETFNLVQTLEECSNLLEDFGGHPQAAGFSIRTEKINELKNAIEKIANKQISKLRVPLSKLIDCKLPIKYLKTETFEFINSLEPFGKGNPEPIFMTNQVFVSDVQKIGANQNHLKFKLRHEGWKGPAIGFNLGHIPVKSGDLIEIIYNAKNKTWSGKKFIELNIIDLKKH